MSKIRSILAFVALMLCGGAWATEQVLTWESPYTDGGITHVLGGGTSYGDTPTIVFRGIAWNAFKADPSVVGWLGGFSGDYMGYNNDNHPKRTAKTVYPAQQDVEDAVIVQFQIKESDTLFKWATVKFEPGTDNNELVIKATQLPNTDDHYYTGWNQSSASTFGVWADKKADDTQFQRQNNLDCYPVTKLRYGTTLAPTASWKNFTAANPVSNGLTLDTGSATFVGGAAVIPSDASNGMFIDWLKRVSWEHTVIIDADVSAIPNNQVTLIDSRIGSNSLTLDYNGGNLLQRWNHNGTDYGTDGNGCLKGRHRFAFAYSSNGDNSDITYVDGIKALVGGAYSSNTAPGMICIGACNKNSYIAKGLKVYSVEIFDIKLTDDQIAQYERPKATGLININFAKSDAGSIASSSDTLATLADGSMIPGTAWNEWASNSVNNDNVTKAYLNGETKTISGMTISVTGKTPYRSGVTPFQGYMKGYIDDQSGTEVKVTLNGIPFSKYDLIVYRQGDTDAHKFTCQIVNDVNYSFNANGEVVNSTDAWGKPNRKYCAYGVNAIRIPDLTASSAVIKSGMFSSADNLTCRGTIAAIQVVDKSETQTPIHWYKMNGNANSSGLAPITFDGHGIGGTGQSYTTGAKGDANTALSITSSADMYNSNVQYGTKDWTAIGEIKLDSNCLNDRPVIGYGRKDGNESNKKGVVIIATTSNEKPALKLRVWDTVNNKNVTSEAGAAIEDACTRFHSYAVVYDSLTYTYILYVDGEEYASVKMDQECVASPKMQFASVYGGGFGDRSNIVIDDWRLYNYKLSIDELKSISDEFAPPVAKIAIGETTTNFATIAEAFTEAQKTASEQTPVTVTLLANISTAINIPQHVIVDTANFSVTGKISGSGVLMIDKQSGSSRGTVSGDSTTGAVEWNLNGLNDSEAWTGTVWLKNAYWSSFHFATLGNKNSTVRLTNVAGYSYNSNNASAGFTGTLELVDDGSTAALTIDNAWNSTYFVSTLKGNGTFATSGTQTSAARYAFVDASKFTGSFNLNGNNKSVTIGDDLDDVNDYCTGNNIRIQASGSATIDSRKTWSATTVTVNGTIKGSGKLGSATTFGDNATIDLTDGALTASGTVTFGNTLNVTGATLDVGMVVLNISNFTGALPSIVGSDLELEFSDGAIRVVPAVVTELCASDLNVSQLMRINGDATLNVDADITGTPAIVNASGSAVTLTLKAVAPKAYVSAADVKKLQLGTDVTLAYDWKPGKIISMNLNSGNSTQTQFYMSGTTVDGTLGGSVPRNSWNNLEGGAGTKNVTLGYNSEGDGSTFQVYGMSLIVTANGTHNSNIGGQVVAPFMHGYIDDAWQNTTANTYTLSGVPFAKYDVIIYFQGDTNNDEARFGAVKINDATKYGFNAAGEVITGVADDYKWGKSRQTKFAYGVNAIRIVEQTESSIKITPLRPTSTQRSTVAAIQIVKTSTDQEDADASEATVKTGDTTVTHLTLASALAAAESGSTVTLLKTVAGGNAVLKDGVTLEIGNYTVTGALDIKTGAIIKENGTPKIDGFATSFDVTYTNVNAFAYRYKDTGTCRSDNGDNPGYNNTKGDKSTGAMLKNHPWIQDIDQAFFTGTEQLTLATAGVMPQENNTVFVHMGHSTGSSYGLYLATGESDDEVLVGYNEGSATNLITKITVPNARTHRHAYVITKDDVTEGDSKTTFVIYLDGLKWKTFVRRPRFEITGGFQVGSDFGGNITSNNNLKRVQSGDSKSYVNFIRVYNRVISEAEIAQYSVDSEYPYTSPNGTYTREIAADGNWVATDQWSDGRANVEKPSVKGNVKLMATHAEGDTASTKTVTVNLNEEVQYEKLTLSGDPMIFESAADSKPIKSVATVIGTTVTLKEGAIDLTAGPTIILDGGKLLLDYSSLTEAAVAEHPIDAKVTDEIEEDENLGTDDAKIAVLTPSEMGRMFVELRYIDSCYHVVAALKPVYLKSDNTLALEDGTAVTSLYDNEQIVVSDVIGYDNVTRWRVNLNDSKLDGHPVLIDYPNGGVSVNSDIRDNQAIEIADGSTMSVQADHKVINATITGEGTFKLAVALKVDGNLGISSEVSLIESGKFVLKTAAATVTVPAAIDSSRVECGVEAMSVKVTTNNDNTVTYSLIGRLATIAGVDCFTKDDILAHPAGTIANIGNGLSVNGDGHLELNGEDLMIAVNEGVISPIVEAANDHNLIISEICPKTTAWDENHKDAGWLELHNTGSTWINFSEYTLGRYNRGKAVKTSEWTNDVTLSIAPGARLVVKTSEDYSAKSKKTIVQYGEDHGNAIVFDSKVNPKKYPLVVLIKGGKVVQNCVVPVDVPEDKSVCFDGADLNGATVSYITTASKGEASNFEGAVAVGPQISPLYAVKDAVDPWQKFPKAKIGEAYPITVPVNPIMDGNAKNEIASVKLIYRIDFGAEVVVDTPMTKSETKDAKNGYTYTGAIPGSAITTAGQLVRWAVKITDVGGNEWRSPSFNYGDDGYQYFGTIVTPSEEQLSGGLNTWHLFADPDEVADGIGTANKKGESCLMNRDADATNFKTTRHPNGGRVGIYDMETGLYYDNVRIDKRGRTTGDFTKKAHGLKFSKSQPFTGTDSLTGEKIECRKSSITAEYGDPTFIRQELAFEVMRRNGVKAPFHYPVRLNLNGQFYQLAFHSERFSDELIEDFYGLDGKGYAYKNVGTFHNGTNNSSERKTPDDGSPDLTINDPKLRAFCDTLNGVGNISESTDFAANPTYSADVSKVVTQSFDLPAWINYMAATKITAETDDTWANLSAYYDINGTGTWMPLAYDMNQSLGQWHFADDRARGRIGLVADKDDFKSHPFYGGLHIRMHNNAGNASGNPNYAYEAIFQSEKFRRLFLRRLRTIMDKEIGATVYADQASEKSALFTSAAQMVAKINDLGLKDRKIWTDYANVDFANNTDRSTNGSCDKIWVWPQSMTEQLGTPQGGLKDLWDSYVKPRRAYLYGKHLASNGSVAVGYGLNLSAGIPAAQSSIDTLKGNFAVEWDDAHQAVVLKNKNNETVDVSGWAVAGRIAFVFPAGTVIDQGTEDNPGTLYITANRMHTVELFGDNLSDQIIIGNGTLNAAIEEMVVRTDTGLRILGNPTDQETWIRFESIYGNTTGDGDTGEWFTLKNIGSEADVNLEGMTICILKDGDPESGTHCHVTLTSKSNAGSLASGDSKKFEQSKFVDYGFSKIQNNKLNIKLYDKYGINYQTLAVEQKDYPIAYGKGAYLVADSTEVSVSKGEWHQVYDAAVKGQGDLTLKDWTKKEDSFKAMDKDLTVLVNNKVTIELANPTFGKKASLKLKGTGVATIKGTATKTNGSSTVINSEGSLVFEDGTYTFTTENDCIQADGDITINGGTFICHSTGNDGIDANGDIIINGGTIFAFTAATETDGNKSTGLDVNSGHSITINGGTVIATSAEAAALSAMTIAGTQKHQIVAVENVSGATKAIGDVIVTFPTMDPAPTAVLVSTPNLTEEEITPADPDTVEIVAAVDGETPTPAVQATVPASWVADKTDEQKVAAAEAFVLGLSEPTEKPMVSSEQTTEADSIRIVDNVAPRFGTGVTVKRTLFVGTTPEASEESSVKESGNGFTVPLPTEGSKVKYIKIKYSFK